MELSSSLSTTLGIDLPGTFAFDYPSITAMAEHILSIMHPSDPDAAEESAVPPADRLLAMPTGVWPEQPGSSLVSVELCARLPTRHSCVGSDTGACGSDGIRLVPFDRWDLESLRVRLA